MTLQTLYVKLHTKRYYRIRVLIINLVHRMRFFKLIVKLLLSLCLNKIVIWNLFFVSKIVLQWRVFLLSQYNIGNNEQRHERSILYIYDLAYFQNKFVLKVALWKRSKVSLWFKWRNRNMIDELGCLITLLSIPLENDSRIESK